MGIFRCRLAIEGYSEENDERLCKKTSGQPIYTSTLRLDLFRFNQIAYVVWRTS
jgi:hypothetical protein